MIDPRKFAKPNIHPGNEANTPFFRFGLDVDGTVTELRRFADAIERGEFLLQSAQFGTTSGFDDYQMHAFMIEYVASEKAPTASTGSKLLYGSGNALPVDAAYQD